MKTTHLLKIVCLLCGAMLQTVSSGAQNVNMIAGGAAHSLFLKNDGSLWAMGYNYDGQLGDGTYSIFPPYYGTNQPQQIVASDVTSIAAGYGHSLFLMSDGSLRAMGWNYFGELGDGSYGLGPYYYSGTNLPEQIVASNVTAIAAGDFHSLFLKSDGSLWAMGENEIGELGNGTFVNAYIPEQIVASNVTAIAAGGSDSFFLKSDGSLWAMGWNGYGQLGDGTHYNSSTPGQIVASNVTAIAAGYGHSLFLKSDGSLWAMGLNTYGQLGDGNTDNCNCFTNDLPEQIVASNVTAIAAGYYHSLFLKSDGSLWAMGDNEYGQLGDGTSGWDNYVNIPEQIVANNVTAIAAGGNHSLFLTSDGSLWAMGDNSNGQLGDGTFNSTNLPEEIVDNDYTYMTNDDNTITITGYTGSGGAVTIPGTINGLSVTSIGDIVFAYSPDVTSVIISDGVTSIGEESFTFCENLTNVTIPASVTNIGDQAFASCTDLKEIIVDPLNLVYQSLNGVLFNYNETTLIQFPGGGPQNYNIPASVSVIGDFAFAYSDVTSVMISTNVNEILKDAFVGCGDLNSITIPGSISTISDFAIMGCISLTNITLCEGICNLGTYAFAECGNLTQIVIPRSVTNFSAGPFFYSSLKQVYFEGNAPNYNAYNAFDLYLDGATMYYLPNTTGWDLYALLSGIPTALWLPQVQTSSTSFGIQTNQFGFNMNWAGGQTVVVEACTDLSNPVWQPVQTNKLTGGSAYFSDPQWTNYPGRFYRLRSP